MQQESGDHRPPDPLLQGAAHSEAASGAQKQDAGLQLQAVRNLSASSVEKPGTPPRLASPKSPQPASSAVADEAACRDALADRPGSMAPQAEPVLQSPADSVKQSAPDSAKELRGIPAPHTVHLLHGFMRPQKERHQPHAAKCMVCKVWYDSVGCADVQQTRIDSLDLEAAQKLIVQLKASLQARELQLERNMQEVASLQDTMQQVMVSLPPAQRRPETMSLCLL